MRHSHILILSRKINLAALRKRSEWRIEELNKELLSSIKKANQNDFTTILSDLADLETFHLQNVFFYISKAIYNATSNSINSHTANFFDGLIRVTTSYVDSRAPIEAASKVLLFLIRKANQAQLDIILSGLGKKYFNRDSYYWLSRAVGAAGRGSWLQVEAANKALLLLIRKANQAQLGRILSGLNSSFLANGYFHLSGAIQNAVYTDGSKAKIEEASKILFLLIEKSNEDQLGIIFSGLVEKNKLGINGYCLLRRNLKKSGTLRQQLARSFIISTQKVSKLQNTSKHIFSLCKKEIVQQIINKYAPDEAGHFLEQNHPVSIVLKHNASLASVRGVLFGGNYYKQLVNFVKTSIADKNITQTTVSQTDSRKIA